MIIFVVMEVIRYQRCLRKRALKAKLYRSLEERRGEAHRGRLVTFFNKMTQFVEEQQNYFSAKLSAVSMLLTPPR